LETLLTLLLPIIPEIVVLGKDL